MNDEKRLCGRCHHQHAWGIVRFSEDRVPLYGARICKHMIENVAGGWYPCHCADFIEDGGTELMVGLPPEELGKLWQETAFLSAQTPMASRIAIRQIMSMDPSPERDKEFMGLMLSQVMDTRALLSNDQNKFAHLVAHTDEIVESMKAVAQLRERLDSVNRSIEENGERMDRLEALMGAIAEKMGVEVKQPEYPEINDPNERPERFYGSARPSSFMNKVYTKMQDEAVVVDGKPVPSRDR